MQQEIEDAEKDLRKQVDDIRGWAFVYAEQVRLAHHGTEIKYDCRLRQDFRQLFNCLLVPSIGINDSGPNLNHINAVRSPAIFSSSLWH